MSQQQVDEIVAQENDYRWSFYFGSRPEVVRPDIQRLGYISAANASRFYAECLAAAGVDSNYVYGVGLAFGLAPETQEAAYLAYYTCTAQYPVDPLDRGYLSRDQLAFMYDYYSNRLTPCLRTFGFTIADPPDRSEFLVASYNGDSWDPYRELALPGDSPLWNLIDARCPPLPAGVYGQRHP